MPETSPVEHYIAMLKHYYGSLRLQAILKEESVDVRALLHLAASMIDPEAIVNICDLGLRQW